MEGKTDIDLRISSKLLDLHKLKRERKFFDKYLTSDVEFYAQLNSADFTDFHTELVSPYLNDSIVVDMGCGQIPYINTLPDFKIKAFYGLDLHYKSLVIAKNNYNKKFPLILIQHSVQNTPFPDNSADIVISSEVLEHLDHPIEYLLEINRICKEGGYLSLSTPCVSVYYFPHNFIRLLKYLKSPKEWYKQLYKKINAHNYWNEALSWHPGIRPKILRDWIKRAGFSVICHTSRLWYTGNPIKLIWRFFTFLEKLGFSLSGKIFYNLLKVMDKIFSLNIPLIKWCGVRQFILCRKI